MVMIYDVELKADWITLMQLTRDKDCNKNKPQPCRQRNQFQNMFTNLQLGQRNSLALKLRLRHWRHML